MKVHGIRKGGEESSKQVPPDQLVGVNKSNPLLSPLLASSRLDGLGTAIRNLNRLAHIAAEGRK